MIKLHKVILYLYLVKYVNKMAEQNHNNKS